MNAQAYSARHTRALTSPDRRRQRWLGWAVTMGLHAAALLALLSYAPAREALALGIATPIMVSLITPPNIAPAKPKPTESPKPLSMPMRPRETPNPMPIIAAPANAPSPSTAPQPAAPPKAAQPVTASAPPVAQTPLPVPLIAPRFDAAYLDNPAPPYPALARRMGEQGKVVLRVLVNAAGAAERVELRASSGSARLDTTALDTVRHWRFVPARQGAEAVPAWVLVPISFSLQG